MSPFTFAKSNKHGDVAAQPKLFGIKWRFDLMMVLEESLLDRQGSSTSLNLLQIFLYRGG